MRSTYSLGTLWGIRLGLNWSVLVLLALLMWLLATEVFPQTNPDLPQDAHFAMAVIASLAFFASILLHEMGHALQARRDGMSIDGITLWLLGGVATFSGGFPSARAEIRIAAAGPAVSAVLAGTFVGLWLIPVLPGGVASVLGWLGLINLALLVFNLIPALPLDGGRILRATVWRIRGDYLVATRACARVAQVIAVLLISAGFGMLLAFGAFGGLWLALIAWFLLQATRAEVAMAERAAGLPGVRELMRPLAAPVGPHDTLAALVRRDGWPPAADAYPVEVDGRSVGLLVLRDVERGDGPAWLDHRVGDRMLPRAEVATLAPGDDIVTAAAALTAAPAGLALVIDGGRAVGAISRADLAGAGAGFDPVSGFGRGGPGA
jgi:Zn-dependent protease/CBS domain-containing protein